MRLCPIPRRGGATWLLAARFPDARGRPREHAGQIPSAGSIAAADPLCSSVLSLLNQPAIEEFFQIAVQSAGTELVVMFRLPRDFLDDSVAVAVFAGKREQNVQRRRCQGQHGAQILFHSLVTIYRIPTLLSRARSSPRQYLGPRGHGKLFGIPKGFSRERPAACRSRQAACVCQGTGRWRGDSSRHASPTS